MSRKSEEREQHLLKVLDSNWEEWDPRIVRFLDAGEPLIERFGFKKTSVEEICQEAGASTKTFYNFFEDKSHFFLVMAIRVTQRILDSWVKRDRTFANHSEKVTEYLRAYIDGRRSYPVLQTVYQEMESVSSVAMMRKMVTRLPLWRTLSELITEGQEAGEFSAGDPVSFALTVYATLNTSLFFIPGKYGTVLYSANKDYEELLIGFVVRGIGGSHE